MLRRNSRLVFIACAMAMAPLEGATAASLDDGLALFRKGERKQALAVFSKYITEGKGSNKSLSTAYAYRGMCKCEQGDARGCVVDTNKAIELDTENGQAYHFRAAGLVSQGKLEQALSDVDRAISGNKNCTHCLGMRALIYLSKGQWKVAIDDSSAALKLGPTYADAYSIRAQAHYELGHHKEALADIEKACMLMPDNNGYAQVKARILSGAGRPGEAKKLVQARGLDGDGTQSYLRAMDLFEAHKYKEAIAAFSALIDRGVKINTKYLFRGECFRALGEHKKAIADYSTFLGLQPEYFDAYIVRASSHARLKQYNLALDDLRQAEKHDPSKQWRAMVERADIYRLLGKYDEALVEVNKAIKLNAKDASIYCVLGNIQEDQMQDDKAVLSYKKALSLDGTNQTALRRLQDLSLQDGREGTLKQTTQNLLQSKAQTHIECVVNAKSLFALHKYDEAALQCTKALVYDPTNDGAHVIRARCMMALKRYDAGVNDWTAVLKGEAKADFFRNRAKCFIGLDKFEQALGDLNQAIKLAPADGNLFLMRSHVLDALGQHNQADADRKRSQQLTTNLYEDLLKPKP